MIELEPEELQARLSGLADGPWADEETLVRKKLRLPGVSIRTLAQEPHLDLTKLALSASAQALQRRLEKPLRPHWTKEIVKKEDIRLRESLDSALTYFQLIELAVETGYLPIEQVPEKVKEELIELIWASPVRNFIHAYDYVTVEFLAQRLGVIGMPLQPLPEVDPKASIKFAAFLATHRQVERDKLIGTWLSFLDDYISQDNEQNEFYDYLTDSDDEPSRRFTTLVAGAHSFVVLLADYFSLSNDASKARYALFYSYWFAKMYGFELGKQGYVKNRELWGRKDSWAMALLRYFNRRAETAGAESLAASEAKRVIQAIFILMWAWDAALKYGGLSRRNPVSHTGVANAALDMNWIEKNMKDFDLYKNT